MAKQVEKGDKIFVIDSIPLPICKPGSVYRSKVCKDDKYVQLARACHTVHKVYYYGLKLQLIVSKQGIPIRAGVAAANIHDANYLGLLDFNEQLSNCELVGDKGYLSSEYQISLFEKAKIKLITPLRSNMTMSSWKKAYRYIRKGIEIVFSQLDDRMMLMRNYAKSLDSLFARIIYKLSAMAVLQWINFKKGKPINPIKRALAY